MALDIKLVHKTFQRLDNELAKLAKKPAQDRVHKFRTSSRRVEALLSEVPSQLHGNDQKVLKLLSRLRKKAGRVRDLDVQIAALRALKFPEANGHKSQLMDALIDERRKRERKLTKAFDKKTVAEVRSRLKRAEQELKFPADVDPLALTLRKLTELNSGAPVTEKLLHQYRIVGKRARYIAELGGDDPNIKPVIERLKRMQDVIGDWHDWLKLTERAEELIGNVRSSALVAMLRNVTQAKFRQSVELVSRIRLETARSQASPGYKPPAKAAA